MKVLDLFSGIGGFSLGLERSGMETVAFCEIEEYPRKVLAKHWPDVPIYEDVRELTGDRLKQDGIAIDVICGGFPCQDISAAGQQSGIGEGTRSGLWSECARLLREIRPRYAIFENVTALLSGDGGRWFEQVLWDISQVGYDAEWHCVPASALGACHKRDRVWIIAYPSAVGNQRLRNEQREPCETRQGRQDYAPSGIVCALADALCKRQQGPGRAEGCGNTATSENWEERGVVNALGWPSVAPVRGADDGISPRLDKPRLAALGNAVVPQIPELIGKAIMAQHNGRST